MKIVPKWITFSFFADLKTKCGPFQQFGPHADQVHNCGPLWKHCMCVYSTKPGDLWVMGYDTSMVASKVCKIIICWLVPPKSTERVSPKREKWPLVPPNPPRINKFLTGSAQVWNWFTKLPSVPITYQVYQLPSVPITKCTSVIFQNCSSTLVNSKYTP